MIPSRLQFPLALALSAILVVAAAIRTHGISVRSISHPEMFVPGIPLPEGISVPAPRMDLFTTVKSTLNSDTHPPGYYVLMWFVTKFFGTSLWALRLPSVLFGVASVGLIFWLGTLMGQRTAGLIAAALLAFNGYHVYWSKTARMYTLTCFLALLTTILLVLLIRGTGSRRLLEISYALVVLVGLSSHVFFWAVFGTQMLWVFLNSDDREHEMPRPLKLQILILILGSPLLAFAAYQSGNQVATLSDKALLLGSRLVQFGFLLSPDGFPTGANQPAIPDNPWTIPRILFLVFSFVVLAAGLRSSRPSNEKSRFDSGGPAPATWFAAAAFAILAILAHIAMAEHFVRPRPLDTLRYTKVMTALPVLFACFGLLLLKNWKRVPRPKNAGRYLMGSQGLVILLLVLPFALLSAFSWLMRPILLQRGLLFVSPFVLLLLAAGLVKLGRNRFVAAGLFVILATLHARSLGSHEQRTIDPLNHREFASRFTPYVQQNDLIFLRPHWDTTPILYYLPADRYRLVGANFREACERNPDSRVWTLLFYDQKSRVERAMEMALREYQVVKTVEVTYGKALLYARKASEQERTILSSPTSLGGAPSVDANSER